MNRRNRITALCVTLSLMLALVIGITEITDISGNDGLVLSVLADDVSSDGEGSHTTDETTKKEQTLKASGKTVSVSFSKLKKSLTIARKKLITVSSAEGKTTYNKVKGNSKITVSKTGNFTIKKGLKKGKTYSVKVCVTAAGNDDYKAGSKTVTVKIKVK